MELKNNLPLLPLRDIVVFPSMVIPLFVGRDKSIFSSKISHKIIGADRILKNVIEFAMLIFFILKDLLSYFLYSILNQIVLRQFLIDYNFQRMIQIL